MKKIKYLVAALLLGTVAVNANPVEIATAQKVAVNFYNRIFTANASTQTLVYTERTSDGQPVYYVFNINFNQGFVIISADDAALPVIGYSNEGPFVMPVANNNVDFWLKERKSEIIAIREQKLAASSEISDKWTAYINNTAEKNTHNTMGSVAPLCKTTWDQSPYYNAMCPGGSVTGCVATAMAQIMYYWKFPAVGLSSSCYYDLTSNGDQNNYGKLCAYYDTSHYAWSAMPLNVSSANKEVAKLMYDCGVSVNMDYSPSGSGALVIGGNPSAQYSYVTYFNYDANTIQGAGFTSFTQSGWIALLEKELNNKRPCQYMGTDINNGGHSWVCDGYNSSNDFHMNWGWSGYANGYFAVSTLNPNIYNFTVGLGAIIGIQPWALDVPTVTNNVSVKVYPNPSNGVFTFEIPTDLKNAQIRVYNLLGQEVNTAIVNGGKSQLNISNQSKGVYLYRVLNENGASVSTGRLVVE